MTERVATLENQVAALEATVKNLCDELGIQNVSNAQSNYSQIV
jgi:hypothetical protein